jgi:hypothetical protein
VKAPDAFAGMAGPEVGIDHAVGATLDQIAPPGVAGRRSPRERWCGDQRL